jgi:hypothetical protein
MATVRLSILASFRSTACTRIIHEAETRQGYLPPLESVKPMPKCSGRPCLTPPATRMPSQASRTPYGQRYIADFDLVCKGRTVRVRSAWIVRIGEDLPRLTGCYVLLE